MRRAGSCTAAVLAALAIAPSLADAQTRWAVLSAASSRDESPRARDVAEHAFAALEAQGEAVTSRERAAARVEGDLSRSFVPAPDELSGRIADVSERVLQDLVTGHAARARDAGEPMLDAAEAHIVALGRMETAARDVANLCLFLVRAELQDRRVEQARALTERCVRNLPRIEAEARLHPPEIGELLEEVRPASRRADHQGTLSVQGAAGEPDGCAVRVNGTRIGSTPWARIALTAGRYSVQVECDPALPGRIFDVSVEPGQTTRLTALARLSQSLETNGSVALVYASPSELTARLAADVAQLGTVLDVDRVLVGVVDGGAVSVRAFEIVRGSALARLSGSTPVAEPVDASSSREAVERARSGRVLHEPGAFAGGPNAAGGGSDVGVAVLGGSFLTVGVVGLAVSWYFWTEIDARGQEIRRSSSAAELTDRQRAFSDALLPVALTGLAGAALATVALPMLLPAEEGVPWWSWIVGGAGVGVAVAGVYFLATEGACYGSTLLDTSCAKQSPHELLGALVLAHAAPLLTVPITYLVRDATGSGRGGAPGATLRLQPMGAGLALSASF